MCSTSVTHPRRASSLPGQRDGGVKQRIAIGRDQRNGPCRVWRTACTCTRRSFLMITSIMAQHQLQHVRRMRHDSRAKLSGQSKLYPRAGGGLRGS